MNTLTKTILTTAAIALALAACGGAAQNYSSTPCFDNCGNDATCQANCTNISNHDPPPVNLGTGH